MLQGRERPGAGGSRCQGQDLPDEASLVLDFWAVLLGLESPGLILGNCERPEVPEDWEKINVGLPIFAKKGRKIDSGHF